MQITPIKTNKITHPAQPLTKVLDRYVPQLSDGSVVAVTSKIVSITQGDVVAGDEIVDKQQLIQQQADKYMEEHPRYPGIVLTIKNNILIPSAGIDESNGNGYLILWPKNLQHTTNTIREHLVAQHNVQNLGVVITDSHTTPLRWGTLGIGLSYSGFAPLKNYIGTTDLFDKQFRFTKENVVDGLAAAATLVMGEGAEQTPLAVITEIPFVAFQNRNPTQGELESLKIPLDEDLYAPLIDTPKWKKGKK